jgi:Domain of unknown function (DUF927)
VDVKAFLAQVLAWDIPGYTTVHWQQRPKGPFLGRSCHSIDDVIATVERLSQIPMLDIYFCLSRQQLNSGERSRKNARGFKCLFLDADVDPGNPNKYQTQAEALIAIFKFCDAVGIPRPSIVVASGGGLHAYWLSDHSLTVEEWQPYADALKVIALDAGLLFDAGVTGDAARVLRVPGTQNWKLDNPRPVYVLSRWSPGTKYNFAEIFDNFEITAPIKKQKLVVNSAFAHLKITELAEGIDTPPPPTFESIIKECPWLREAYETGGKAYPQPQWNLTTLVATFMENGNELAHRLGNKYPTYNYGKAEDLWHRKMRERRDKNLGWPSCRAISYAGAAHCRTCKHFVEDRSPLNFGSRPFEDPDAEPEDEDLKELGGTRPPDLQLPPGYALNEAGRICAIIRAKVTKGKRTPARLLQLFSNVIRNPTLQFQEGMFGLSFISTTDKGGEHEVFLSCVNTLSAGVLSHLRSKLVMWASSTEMDKIVQVFAEAWLDKIRALHVAQRDAGTLGWRYENGVRVGFAYGGVLHMSSGATAPLTNTSEDEFRKWYMPVGKKEVWLRAAKLLTDRQQPELDIIIAVAFAAPLVPFIGNMYGAILSIWGEPGTAKSTAQQVAAAVWGHPKQTRESLTSTPKSVQGRLGRIKNLPAYWDDIQDEKHQDYLSQTMFVATEGTEGGRLNPDATYKERKDWQTMLVACSNASFVEYLLKKQKSTTAGLRRVLEFTFNKNPDNRGMVNALDANRTFAELEHNFGVVGFEYAKILATEHAEIAELVKRISDQFTEKVQGESDETFWIGLCGTLLAGAELACRLGAEIDVVRMEQFLLHVLLRNREIRRTEGTEGGSVANTEMGLSGFLNKYVGEGQILYVDAMYRHRSVTVTPIHYPTANRQIMIQISVNERKIVLSKRAFREYLQEQGIHTRQVLDGLVKYYHAKDIKIAIGGGTSVAQAQEHCIEMPIPFGHAMLEDIFHARKPKIDPSTKATPSA